MSEVLENPRIGIITDENGVKLYGNAETLTAFAEMILFKVKMGKNASVVFKCKDNQPIEIATFQKELRKRS